MEQEENSLPISEKFKRIIYRYCTPEIFKKEGYSFTPICIIRVDNDKPFVNFERMEEEFKAIGFLIKFYQLTKKEYQDYDLHYEESSTRYLISFKAIDFTSVRSQKSKRRTTIIQVILLVSACFTIYYSAIFYITYVEPFYGDYGAISIRSISSILSFCIGMLLIVVVHELGHVYYSRRHNLKVSSPYLIPGPPPLGMFGAFVSIKDDPRTRNQKFDVAIGGIVLGIGISCLLLIIGFLFSTQIDTDVYIQNMVLYSGDSATEVAADLNRHLNSYNLMFLGLRYLFFDASFNVNLYGFTLPNQVIILHPLAYTGWIGLLLSGLNLIPLSFQDGGHLLKAIFPNRFTKLIGLIIGIVIWIILDIQLWMIALVGLSGAINDISSNQKVSSIPNPTIPLTKLRKIVAMLFIGFFILLWPLTFNRLLFGIGF